MNQQHRKNRLTIVVIFAMSIIPFAIAWYLATHPTGLKLGTNHGELISPVITTEIEQFKGHDRFSAQNIQELQGHWVLINMVTNDTCSELCRDGLYKTHQIALMMGKDIARIRRMVMMPLQVPSKVLSDEWEQDARLLKIDPVPALLDTLKHIGVYQDGSLLVMDPLGNLMMHYAAGYDPYQVRNDLSKLLRISQIG